jgi:hypothetical protein
VSNTTVTVLQLMSGTRELSDSVGDSFVGDAALLDYIQRGSLALYDVLVEKFSAKYFNSVYYLTTAAGTESYGLPSDFYKLHGVDVFSASGSSSPFRRALPYMFEERDRFQTQGGWAGVYAPGGPRYNVRANEVHLLPVPTDARTVRLEYAPSMTPVASTGQQYDWFGWDEFIVCHAARRILTKQEKSTAEVDLMLKEVSERIDSAAGWRDAGEPDHIVDVDGWGGL